MSVEASAADLCADLVKKLSSPVVGACKAFELPSSPRIAEQNMAERVGIELRDLLRQLYVYRQAGSQGLVVRQGVSHWHVWCSDTDRRHGAGQQTSPAPLSRRSRQILIEPLPGIGGPHWCAFGVEWGCAARAITSLIF